VAGRLDRRQFLGRSLLAGAGLAAFGGGTSTVLAACGSSSKGTTAGTTGGSGGSGQFGAAKFQLSWIEDVEFAGEYIADTNGYFTQAGFSSMALLAGGSGVNQDAVVAAGTALVCISSPDITSPKILQGADLVTIAAQYQKNPFCITSLASNPLPNPQAMLGKKIGVQSTNLSAWKSFLKANDIKESQLTTANVGFDPTPLADGQVDGWFSFITNEPIQLESSGHPVTTFLLNDYNYPLVSQTIVTQTSSIQNKRDALKALLKADLMGWRASLKDPTIGAHLAVEKYGKSQGLKLDTQILQSKAQNKLILDDRTKSEGIFTVPASEQEATVKTLALGGTNITTKQLFDMSLLDEVYQENPDLMSDPTA